MHVSAQQLASMFSRRVSPRDHDQEVEAPCDVPEFVQTLINSTRRLNVHRVWTEKEDEALVVGVRQFGLPNWKQISRVVKTRSNIAVKDKMRNLAKNWRSVRSTRVARNCCLLLFCLIRRFIPHSGTVWSCQRSVCRVLRLTTTRSNRAW